MANPSWKTQSPFPAHTPEPVAKTLKYREAQEHLVRRLGGALVLQWDALSDELQDLLIDQAGLVDDRADAPHAREDIERFLRTVKTVPLKRPEAADMGAHEAAK